MTVVSGALALLARLLSLLDTLLIAVGAVVRAAAAQRRATVAQHAKRCPDASRVQLGLLNWTPPRWLAWLMSWAISFAQADAEVNSRKATSWLRGFTLRGSRLLAFAPIGQRIFGGGLTGLSCLLFVSAVLDNPDERQVPSACPPHAAERGL